MVGTLEDQYRWSGSGGVSVYSPTRPVRTSVNRSQGAIRGPNNAGFQSIMGGQAPFQIHPPAGFASGNQPGMQMDLGRRIELGPQPVSEPEQQHEGGWRGLLGSIVNNPIGKAVLMPLNLLDTPRRIIVSTVKELGDIAAGHGGASFGDWWDQVKDPNFGVGSFLHINGPNNLFNRWANRLIGLTGDILLDPMTYIGGSSMITGASRRARLTMGAAASAIEGISPEVAQTIARRGVGTLDDATRRILSEAGVPIKDAGYYWKLPLIMGEHRRIPGTAQLDRLMSRTTGRVLPGVSNTVIGKGIGHWANDESLQGAARRMLTGEGPESFQTAAATYLYAQTHKPALRTAERVGRSDATRLLAEHGEDAMNAAIHESETLGTGPAAEFFQRARVRNEQGGVRHGIIQTTLPDGSTIVTYAPHYRTPEFDALLNNGTPMSAALKKALGSGATFDDISQSAQRRMLKPRTEPYDIMGKELYIRTGTIREFNEQIAKLFPDFKGKALYDDFATISKKYVIGQSRDIAQMAGVRKLYDTGLIRKGVDADPLVKEAIDTAATKTASGKELTRLKTADRVAGKAVREARTNMSAHYSQITGELGDDLHKIVDDMQTLPPEMQAKIKKHLTQGQVNAGATKTTSNEAVREAASAAPAAPAAEQAVEGEVMTRQEFETLTKDMTQSEIEAAEKAADDASWNYNFENRDKPQRLTVEFLRDELKKRSGAGQEVPPELMTAIDEGITHLDEQIAKRKEKIDKLAPKAAAEIDAMNVAMASGDAERMAAAATTGVPIKQEWDGLVNDQMAATIDRQSLVEMEARLGIHQANINRLQAARSDNALLALFESHLAQEANTYRVGDEAVPIEWKYEERAPGEQRMHVPKHKDAEGNTVPAKYLRARVESGTVGKPSGYSWEVRREHLLNGRPAQVSSKGKEIAPRTRGLPEILRDLPDDSEVKRWGNVVLAKAQKLNREEKSLYDAATSHSAAIDRAKAELTRKRREERSYENKILAYEGRPGRQAELEEAHRDLAALRQGSLAEATNNYNTAQAVVSEAEARWKSALVDYNQSVNTFIDVATSEDRRIAERRLIGQISDPELRAAETGRAVELLFDAEGRWGPQLNAARNEIDRLDPQIDQAVLIRQDAEAQLVAAEEARREATGETARQRRQRRRLGESQANASEEVKQALYDKPRAERALRNRERALDDRLLEIEQELGSGALTPEDAARLQAEARKPVEEMQARVQEIDEIVSGARNRAAGHTEYDDAVLEAERKVRAAKDAEKDLKAERAKHSDIAAEMQDHLEKARRQADKIHNPLARDGHTLDRARQEVADLREQLNQASERAAQARRGALAQREEAQQIVDTFAEIENTPRTYAAQREASRQRRMFEDRAAQLEEEARLATQSHGQIAAQLAEAEGRVDRLSGALMNRQLHPDPGSMSGEIERLFTEQKRLQKYAASPETIKVHWEPVPKIPARQAMPITDESLKLIANDILAQGGKLTPDALRAADLSQFPELQRNALQSSPFGKGGQQNLDTRASEAIANSEQLLTDHAARLVEPGGVNGHAAVSQSYIDGHREMTQRLVDARKAYGASGSIGNLARYEQLTADVTRSNAYMAVYKEALATGVEPSPEVSALILAQVVIREHASKTAQRAGMRRNLTPAGYAKIVTDLQEKGAKATEELFQAIGERDQMVTWGQIGDQRFDEQKLQYLRQKVSRKAKARNKLYHTEGELKGQLIIPDIDPIVDSPDLDYLTNVVQEHLDVIREQEGLVSVARHTPMATTAMERQIHLEASIDTDMRYAANASQDLSDLSDAIKLAEELGMDTVELPPARILEMREISIAEAEQMLRDSNLSPELRYKIQNSLSAAREALAKQTAADNKWFVSESRREAARTYSDAAAQAAMERGEYGEAAFRLRESERHTQNVQLNEAIEAERRAKEEIQPTYVYPNEEAYRAGEFSDIIEPSKGRQTYEDVVNKAKVRYPVWEPGVEVTELPLQDARDLLESQQRGLRKKTAEMSYSMLEYDVLTGDAAKQLDYIRQIMLDNRQMKDPELIEAEGNLILEQARAEGRDLTEEETQQVALLQARAAVRRQNMEEGLPAHVRRELLERGAAIRRMQQKIFDDYDIRGYRMVQTADQMKNEVTRILNKEGDLTIEELDTLAAMTPHNPEQTRAVDALRKTLTAMREQRTQVGRAGSMKGRTIPPQIMSDLTREDLSALSLMNATTPDQIEAIHAVASLFDMGASTRDVTFDHLDTLSRMPATTPEQIAAKEKLNRALDEISAPNAGALLTEQDIVEFRNLFAAFYGDNGADMYLRDIQDDVDKNLLTPMSVTEEGEEFGDVGITAGRGRMRDNFLARARLARDTAVEDMKSTLAAAGLKTNGNKTVSYYRNPREAIRQQLEARGVKTQYLTSELVAEADARISTLELILRTLGQPVPGQAQAPDFVETLARAERMKGGTVGDMLTQVKEQLEANRFAESPMQQASTSFRRDLRDQIQAARAAGDTERETRLVGILRSIDQKPKVYDRNVPIEEFTPPPVDSPAVGQVTAPADLVGLQDAAQKATERRTEIENQLATARGAQQAAAESAVTDDPQRVLQEQLNTVEARLAAMKEWHATEPELRASEVSPSEAQVAGLEIQRWSIKGQIAPLTAEEQAAKDAVLDDLMQNQFGMRRRNRPRKDQQRRIDEIMSIVPENGRSLEGDPGTKVASGAPAGMDDQVRDLERRLEAATRDEETAKNALANAQSEADGSVDPSMVDNESAAAMAEGTPQPMVDRDGPASPAPSPDASVPPPTTSRPELQPITDPDLQAVQQEYEIALSAYQEAVARHGSYAAADEAGKEQIGLAAEQVRKLEGMRQSMRRDAEIDIMRSDSALKWRFDQEARAAQQAALEARNVTSDPEYILLHGTPSQKMMTDYARNWKPPAKTYGIGAATVGDLAPTRSYAADIGVQGRLGEAGRTRALPTGALTRTLEPSRETFYDEARRRIDNLIDREAAQRDEIQSQLDALGVIRNTVGDSPELQAREAELQAEHAASLARDNRTSELHQAELEDRRQVEGDFTEQLKDVDAAPLVHARESVAELHTPEGRAALTEDLNEAVLDAQEMVEQAELQFMETGDELNQLIARTYGGPEPEPMQFLENAAPEVTPEPPATNKLAPTEEPPRIWASGGDLTPEQEAAYAAKGITWNEPPPPGTTIGGTPPAAAPPAAPPAAGGPPPAAPPPAAGGGPTPPKPTPPRKLKMPKHPNKRTGTASEWQSVLNDLNDINEVRRIVGTNDESVNKTAALLVAAARDAKDFAQQEIDYNLIHKRLLDFQKGSEQVANVMKDVAADGWRMLTWSTLPEGEKHVITEELGKSLDNFHKAISLPDTWNLLDHYTRFFKTYATGRPGFHVRNTMSSMFMNLVAGVRLSAMWDASSLWRQFEKSPYEFLSGLDPNSNEFKAFSAVFGSGAAGAFEEVATKYGETIPGRAWRAVIDNRYTRWNQRMGARVEGSIRLGMALDSMRRGSDVMNAMNRIAKFHFDYTEMTALDRQARRIIPFWTFLSRNLPLQIEQMWARPRVYLQYKSLVRNFGEVPDPLTPQYWLDAGAWTTDENAGTDTVHSPSSWLLQPDLPFQTAGETINALTEGNIGKAILSDINPAILSPMEAFGFNRKLYTGAPLEEGSYHEMNPAQIWMLPLFKLLGAAKKNIQGETIIDDRYAHVARTLNPVQDLAERLLDTTGTRAGRQDETLMRFLGIPVRELTPNVRANTRTTAYYDARDEARQRAQIARAGTRD